MNYLKPKGFINITCNNIYTTAFILLLIIALVASCARPMAPTGGPKDEDPPVPLKSKPLNYSTNFTDDKIIIQFDEFLALKNVTQELLVSPPLEEQPEIKLRGKNLIINIESPLKDSTTYGINFYESITDLNEGNLLKNFQFEFSTGSEFDSLYVGGNIKNAFNFTTEKGLFVMLYEVFNDSTPRKQKPAYISKTDEDGNFFITNMKNKPYYIFALKDLNNNHLFDLPNEQIAFSNQTFQPAYIEIEMVDSIKYIDSISPNLKDTIFADSIHRHMEMVTTIDDIRLFLFQEDVQQQYFKEAYRPERQQVIFAFNTELSDSFEIKPLVDSIPLVNTYKQEILEKNDSIVYWLRDSNIFKIDSLEFELNYTMKDSNNEFFTKTDTVLLFFEDNIIDEKKDKKEKKERKFSISNLTKKKETEVIDTVIPSLLTFSSNIKTTFDLDNEIFLTARFPISSGIDSLFQFIKMVDDTIETTFPCDISIDTNSVCQINITFDKKEEEKFKLLIPAGAIRDIYGNINDTLKYEFTTQALDYYGTISLKIMGVKENSMIQMLDKKEELIVEQNIKNDTILNFKYVRPKDLIFKLYYDINNNKKWDTGNYKDLLQPEEVFYFPEEIKIKSNFDYEYNWDLYPILESTQKDKSEIKYKKD